MTGTGFLFWFRNKRRRPLETGILFGFKIREDILSRRASSFSKTEKYICNGQLLYKREESVNSLVRHIGVLSIVAMDTLQLGVSEYHHVTLLAVDFDLYVFERKARQA